jgi:hypothetical protein
MFRNKNLNGILLALTVLAMLSLPGHAAGNATAGNMTPSVMPNQIATQNTTSASTQNMTNATVMITMPQNGSVLSGGNVTVTAGVQHFDIVPPTGPNVKGSGHAVFLKDTKVPSASGQTVTASNKSLMFVPPIPGLAYTWMNVTPGNHSLSVVLVNNDNTTLNPPASNTVYIVETGVEGVTAALEAAMNQTTTQNQTTAMNQAVTQNQTMAMNLTQNMTQNQTTVQNMTMAQNMTVVQNQTISQNMIGIPAPATVSSGKVIVGITAMNMAFNTTTITVPASSSVTINFNNQDSGIYHNIAIYTDASANKSIFIGLPVIGISTIDYSFTAPSSPGTYFFRDNIHPRNMTGQFIVQ